MNPIVRIIIAILATIVYIVLLGWLFSSLGAPQSGLLATLVGIILGAVTYYYLPKNV